MAIRSTTSVPNQLLLSHAAISDAATRLKPLTRTVVQLIALNGQRVVTKAELSAIIGQDQVLTVAMLREANSAAHASSMPVTTVETVFVRLGMTRVLTLAIRFSLTGYLSQPVPQYRLDDGELALLSLTGSIGAEIVAKFAAVALPPETAIAALVRDIGLLVLANFITDPDLMMLHGLCDSGLPLGECERMVMDVDHGDAGGLLCQVWRLPESVRLGVQYHHDPVACDEPIAHAVFIADEIAHRISVSTGRSWSHSESDAAAVAASMTTLGIDPELLDSMVEVTIARFEERNDSLTL